MIHKSLTKNEQKRFNKKLKVMKNNKEKCIHRYNDLAIINASSDTSVICNNCGKILIERMLTQLQEEWEKDFDTEFAEKLGYKFILDQPRLQYYDARDDIKLFIKNLLAAEHQKGFIAGAEAKNKSN